MIDYFNSLHASSDYCCLLITFANSLDPDEDPNDFTLIVFLKKK